MQGKTSEVEPWYQTEYSQEPVPSHLLSGWLKAYPNDSIHLPRPNPFISSQFGLIDVRAGAACTLSATPTRPLAVFLDVLEHGRHHCPCTRYLSNR